MILTVAKRSLGFHANKSGNRWIIVVAHRLRFHSAIPDDLVNALDYFEGVSHTLANRFRDSVDKRLDDIAKIDRFPYLIFFAVKSGFALIIAIVYGASDPNKWRSRG